MTISFASQEDVQHNFDPNDFGIKAEQKQNYVAYSFFPCAVITWNKLGEEKKKSGPCRIWTHDLCDTGAAL